jgi:hypothetical protein
MMEHPTRRVYAALRGSGRADAIVRKESFGLWEIRWNAGRDGRFAALDLTGDFQVQGEESGQQILLGAEAVGGKDGGVYPKNPPNEAPKVESGIEV